MCNSIFSGPRLKDMKNIQVCTECLQELCPTQDSKLYTSFYKAAGCQSSMYVKCVDGGRGGGQRDNVCHTKSVHKEKHPKNNYSAANTACNPLKPHEAGHS